MQQLIIEFRQQVIRWQSPKQLGLLLEPTALKWIAVALIVRSIRSKFIQAELIVVNKLPIAEYTVAAILAVRVTTDTIAVHTITTTLRTVVTISYLIQWFDVR